MNRQECINANPDRRVVGGHTPDTLTHHLSAVIIRPIRRDDEPLLVRFHQNLSAESVYLRYFSCLPLHRRTDHNILRQQCLFNYNGEITFVADCTDGSARAIVGIASLYRRRSEAELAVAVTDSFQRRGIGSALVTRLVDFAYTLRLNRLVAFVLLENRPMQMILEHHGFIFKGTATGGIREGQLALSAASVAHAASEPDRMAYAAYSNRKLTASLRTLTAAEPCHEGTIVLGTAIAA